MKVCLKCNYEWEEKPKGHLPKKCPKCQRYDWNKPRVWVRNPSAPINIGAKQEAVDSW